MDKELKVRGMVAIDFENKFNCSIKDLFVRYKKDDIGESLFIGNEEAGYMMMIPFEKIRKDIGGNL